MKEPWKPLLLLVEWRDACADTDDWINVDDFKPANTISLTVGWLLYEDKDCLVLCQTKGLNDRQAGSTWEIPAPWVVRREVLKSPGTIAAPGPERSANA